MWMAELRAVTFSSPAVLRPTRRDALAYAVRSSASRGGDRVSAAVDESWAGYERERAEHRWTDHHEVPLAPFLSQIAADAEGAELIRMIADRFADCLEWHPDALPTLDYLRESGYRTVLVLDLPMALPGVWQERARPWFDEMVCTADLLRRTPDPAPFQEALRRLRLGPAKVLHVGEGLVEDVHAAATHHLRTALLERFGRPAPDPEAAAWLRRARQVDPASVTPDLKLRTLEDLPRALDAFG